MNEGPRAHPFQTMLETSMQERLEVLVHKQMAAANADDGAADVIRTHGLLRIVRRREVAA